MIRNSKGMTLVELMVVVVIVGIMSAMAIPMIRNTRPKLKAAARDIISDLQVTRLNAMRDGRLARWRLTFDSDGKSYTVSHLTSLGNDNKIDTDDDGYETDKTVNLGDRSPNIKFGSGYGPIPDSDADTSDGVTFTGNKVTFRSDGSANMGGTIYVMDIKSKDTIATSVVFTTGRIHTYANFGKGWGG
jgi:prepilin-type N-terminal cleavage/methylation domain-containing protein